jgi:hypothetical protein
VNAHMAQAIMGRNFLGVEAVRRHFGVSFTETDLVALGTVPFSEEVLKQCKDTHVLFCGALLTLLQLRGRVPELFYEQDWYAREYFATTARVAQRWYLMRKDAVPHSTSKTFEQQTALLGENESVPRACEVAYGVVLYFMTTGEPILTCRFVRCSDIDSEGDRVNTGILKSAGRWVLGISDDCRYHLSLGLATVRNPLPRRLCRG